MTQPNESNLTPEEQDVLDGLTFYVVDLSQPIPDDGPIPVTDVLEGSEELQDFLDNLKGDE